MLPHLNILGFEVPVYFLFLSLVFTLAVPFIVRRADRLEMSPLSALDLYVFVLIGSFLGSRGLYILYQEPAFYLEHPEQILFFWNGGYIFFGGFLGAVIAGVFFCKFKKMNIEKWFNFSIPLLSLGYAVGRLSCFLSGCCYGRELNAWWSVFMHNAYRHPTQLYASVMEFVIFAILLKVEKNKGFKSYLTLPLWLVLHGFARIVMEFYRADPRGDKILGLSVSTQISFFIIVVGFVILKTKMKTKKNILQ